jgi:hypothetical protein
MHACLDSESATGAESRGAKKDPNHDSCSGQQRAVGNTGIWSAGIRRCQAHVSTVLESLAACWSVQHLNEIAYCPNQMSLASPQFVLPEAIKAGDCCHWWIYELTM